MRVLLALALASSAVAQDLGVPLSWRKFSNTRSRDERITISQNAINAILPQLNAATGEFIGIGYWQSGNVWSSLANQDRNAGTTVNKARVVSNLNLVFSRFAHYDQFGFNDDAMWWAQAALYAHRAYNDANLLAHAVDVWNHVSTFALTTAQASAGRIPTKSFNIQPTCNGQTMAGGVFWQTAANNNAINSITTGLYMTLSAFLADTTGDAKYRNAAILSANWIKNHQINPNGIILDTVNADCTTTPANWLFTYNSGKFIEGLSVLGAITGDASWTNLMINTLNSAVKSNAWQGSDGIITEGASPNSNNDGVGFKAVFIRALHEAWTRVPSNQALRTLIHSYGDVQMNALLDLAATGSTYSSAWHGPAQAFTTWGQMAALDVFVTNIDTN